MEMPNIQRVYLVGIGGIGMSGLARYFRHRGYDVAGYDRTRTVLTERLAAEGIPVVYEDDPGLIPASYRTPGDDTLVVYTPAVPKGSAIMEFFRSGGFGLRKRSEVLGIISRGMYTIAVAGTHGKTTTSSIIAHLLKATGYDCSAFLGGIATNYDSNVLFGDNQVVVVEADEYDRSFLTLNPDLAVITSMDADHLDIYGAKENLTSSFRQFARQVKPGGKLFYRLGLPLEEGVTYAAEGPATVHAENIRIEDGAFVFDFRSPGHVLEGLRIALPGLHNIENAVASVQVALELGIRPEAIREALATFRGVRRRFEYMVRSPRHIYIDDYAHHPEELRACIAAVRALYPGKKLTTIFQPHLFTRTRDFAEGFAEVLAGSDELIFLDIYPARELPIEGVSSATIMERISGTPTRLCSKEEVLHVIRQERPELLLTVGAGDIDTLVQPLKKILEDA